MPEPTCCLCPVPLQRTPQGSLLDGFDQHIEIVHPVLGKADEAKVATARRRLLMAQTAGHRR